MAYTDIYISLVSSMEIKKRAVDFIWSRYTFRLNRFVKDPAKCVFYYLQGGSDGYFVGEELMHIPQDTREPPEWVSKWK